MGRDLDAAVDHVQEQEALLLVLECHLAAPPEDDRHDFFEVVREGSGSAVGDEAEGPNRAHHLLAGLGAGATLVVEDTRYRGDRHAGPAGDVVDRRDRLGAPRPCHAAALSLLRVGKRLQVTAYR